MSKQMTPCEKLGYKVGDKFKVVDGTGVHYAVGSFITLIHDDGSSCPRFNGVHAIYESGDSFFPLDFVEKVEKLKPAKQALADAIHQNGGWLVAGDYNYVASNHRGVVKFFHEKPLRNGVNWVGCSCSLAWVDLHQQLPNWHQALLSRDEYFTAYPEQVKVEVDDETERKVGVEMKSESEATINASDWHKNGELPPVGGVCEAHITSENIWVEIEVVAHKDGFALGWCRNEKCGYHGNERSDFRPLRTEREMAIDEMVGEFIDHYGDPKGGERYLGIATKLYDLGYRNEVK